MKQWLSASEIAGLRLPGMPNTTRGVNKWLSKRTIDPENVRRRSGIGGGQEYRYTILPKAARDTHVIRQFQRSDAPPIEEIFTGAHAIPEPPSSQAGELRRDAILVILNFWDIFKSKSLSSIENARFEFTVMYRNGKIEGIPEWVTRAMQTRDGREKAFCVNTLRNWEQKRNHGDFNALAGDHGNRKGSAALDLAEDGRVATFIAARIVRHPQWTAKQHRKQVRGEFGDTIDVKGEKQPVPPVRTFQRWISAWREEHAEALLKMTDPDAFKSKMKFSGSNMNHWVKRPNQLWEIDASPADVLLTDGRYSIYAVVDIFTRRMMVTVTKTPKTDAVLGLMRVAIQAWGVPEILRTDNGSDFVSHRFKNALAHLAIHHDITDPFSPEQKGTVERHIGTLQRGLMPLLPGFVGHNVTDRKKIEARRGFAKRLGEDDKDVFCVDLTHDELQEKVDRWLELDYSHSAHGGLNGRTPFEVIAAWSGPIRKIENERALDVLLAPLAGKDGIRTVTKHGIRYDKAHFIHGNLVPGSEVFVRVDPEDMGRIYVYSRDGREFICVAECPERLGVDPGAAVRAARELQSQRIAAEVDPLNREIRAIKPRDAIDAAIRVAARDAGTLTAFPKQSETHTSPELEAAAEAAAIDDPKPAPALTPKQESIRSEVVADLATYRTDKPKTDIELKRERYTRARALEDAIANGDSVDPEDARWLGGYQTTAEYRAMKSMTEDFAANQA